MRLMNEDQILDPIIRKLILEEIASSSDESQRKNDHYKRDQVYRDQTHRFVLDFLRKQFSANTVEQMEYALTNVSLCKKVIDKLSKVYSFGVDRSIPEDEQATKNIGDIEKYLDVNTAMKDMNRLLKLHRTMDLYIRPIKNDDGSFNIKLEPTQPYLYSVVERHDNREEPMCYILSDYNPSNIRYTEGDAASVDRSLSNSSALPETIGNRRDELIADVKEDKNADSEVKQHIWWTNKYHFTTDQSGTIIDPATQTPILNPLIEELLNPIERLPFVNFSTDRSGQFWSRSGGDLISSSILINSLLTQANHISIVQGYGQFYMTGKKLPRHIEMGPSNAIIIEYDPSAEEPKPEIGFANASPQLGEIRALIDSQVAMLLTTNNLSTSGVSSNLNNTQVASSGIALIIDKSESMEDIKDQRQVFIDGEQNLWEIINKWIILFQGEGKLDENLQGKALPEGFELQIEFGTPVPLISESEKLSNLKTRKELGLNTEAELIMMDQPSLNDEQAKQKLEEIKAEKQAKMDAFMPNMPMNESPESEEPEEDKDGSKEDESDEQ